MKTPTLYVYAPARLTLRQRLAAHVQILGEFLSLDDWSDDLIAPAELIERARALQQGSSPLATPQTFARETSDLAWSPTLDCGRVEHKTAVQACADLRLHGHTDWRLPTIQELLSLVDYTRSDPAIDIAAFPDTKSAFYWSSSAYAPNPAVYAWGVYFYDGSSVDSYRVGDGFVRAVRGPVARPGQ